MPCHGEQGWSGRRRVVRAKKGGQDEAGWSGQRRVVRASKGGQAGGWDTQPPTGYGRQSEAQ